MMIRSDWTGPLYDPTATANLPHAQNRLYRGSLVKSRVIEPWKLKEPPEFLKDLCMAKWFFSIMENILSMVKNLFCKAPKFSYCYRSKYTLKKGFFKGSLVKAMVLHTAKRTILML